MFVELRVNCLGFEILQAYTVSPSGLWDLYLGRRACRVQGLWGEGLRFRVITRMVVAEIQALLTSC